MDTPRLIGLCGFAGAGKDVVASYMRESWDFVVFRFADPLKDLVAREFGYERDKMNDLWYKQAPQGPYAVPPRLPLQTVGTDGFRAACPDFWVHKTMERVDDYLETYANSVVIPDVRFPNELEAITKRGGEVWRILRDWKVNPDADVHESETALLGVEVTKVFNAPSGGLDELRMQVYCYIEKPTSLVEPAEEV